MLRSREVNYYDLSHTYLNDWFFLISGPWTCDYVKYLSDWGIPHYKLLYYGSPGACLVVRLMKHDKLNYHKYSYSLPADVHFRLLSGCRVSSFVHEFNIYAERNCFLKGFCYFFPEFWFSLLTTRYTPLLRFASTALLVHLNWRLSRQS